MTAGGGLLLFRTGGTGFALPLGAVLRLTPPGAWEAGLDPVSGEPVPASAAGPPPEGVALVRSEGLTLGVRMDTIVGIEGSTAATAHPVPRLLSSCRWLAGLVEAEGELYLLLDPCGVARPPGGVPVGADRGELLESQKAQEDAEQ